MPDLTHIDAAGRARMVDVSDKPATARTAVAEGFIAMAPATLALLESGETPGQRGPELPRTQNGDRLHGEQRILA